MFRPYKGHVSVYNFRMQKIRLLFSLLPWLQFAKPFESFSMGDLRDKLNSGVGKPSQISNGTFSHFHQLKRPLYFSCANPMPQTPI